MNSLLFTTNPAEALQEASERKTVRAALPDGFASIYGGAELGPKADVPILLLGHGRTTFKPTRWSGHAVDHQNRSWASRCLVPVQGMRVTAEELGGDGLKSTEYRQQWGEWFYLAGVWGTWSEYSFETAGFALLSAPAEPENEVPRGLLVVPRNLARDWLNPAKDSRYLVRQFSRPELAVDSLVPAA